MSFSPGPWGQVPQAPAPRRDRRRDAFFLSLLVVPVVAACVLGLAAASCGAWASTAGVMLGTPVLDPRGVLARFTPQGTTPVAVVVNSRGSITALATDNGSGALPINVQSAYR